MKIITTIWSPKQRDKNFWLFCNCFNDHQKITKNQAQRYCVHCRVIVITEWFCMLTFNNNNKQSDLSTVTMNLSPVSVKKEMLQSFSFDLIWHRSLISVYFSDAYAKFNESTNLIWIIHFQQWSIFSKVIHNVTRCSFADWS